MEGLYAGVDICNYSVSLSRPCRRRHFEPERLSSNGLRIDDI
jgi:hypothetical protein